MAGLSSNMLFTRHLRIISLLLAFAWMGIIFYLSGLPDIKLPGVEPGFDKLYHAGAYGLLAVLYMGAMQPGERGYRPVQVLTATLLAGLYGLSDEWHQSFVPSRMPDVWDLVADVTGALVATAGTAIALRQLGKRAESVSSS